MIVKVPRNCIFITQELCDRNDLQGVKKYKESFTFNTFLEKLKKMGIEISDNVIVTDNIAKLDAEKKSPHIFVAGFSTDGKGINHAHYIDHFTTQGVPIILVSDEKSFCDFILLDFNESEEEKSLNKVVFECLKTPQFKNECTLKEKYCENKKIFETYPELISKLQLILRKIPTIQKTKRIPIFTYSFFLDFLIWQKTMGEDLSIIRISRIEEEINKERMTLLQIQNPRG